MGIIIENNVVICCDGNDSELEIPYGTTMIGKNAFNGSPVKSVFLPFTMKYIQRGAFRDCRELSFIDLGSTKSLGEYAFKGCCRLKEVVGTDSLDYVYRGAFQDCPSLSDRPVFPKNAVLEDEIFTPAPRFPEHSRHTHCSSKVFRLLDPGRRKNPSNYIASLLKSGWTLTFLQTKDTPDMFSCSYDAGKNTIFIRHMFMGLEKARAPYPYAKIFRESVETITWDEGLQYILHAPEGAVYAVKALESEKNPDAMDLYDFLFSSSDASTVITFRSDSDILHIAGRDFVLNENGMLWKYTGKRVKNIACQADFIKGLCEEAFSCHTELTGIDLSRTICEEIPDRTFEGCTKLKAIALPKKIKRLGAWAFSGCSALTCLDLSACTSLEEISYECFLGCSSLKAVIVPSGTVSIDSTAFTGCSAQVRYAA